MGTRHITVVKSKGKVKVAQYGQWDGYPTGQGETIAEFIKKADLPKFKKQVDALGVYTTKAIEKAYKDAGHDGGEWVKGEVSDEKNRKHPALDRDHGAGILQLIHDGIVKKVQLCNDFNIKAGKVIDEATWIEYWYLIDLDGETVSMNGSKAYPFKSWTVELMKKLADKESEE